MEVPLPGMFEDVGYTDVKGHILAVQNGVIVVPFAENTNGWWDVVVVGHLSSADSRTKDAYPVGGYHLALSPRSIRDAIRIPLKEGK